MVKQPLVVMNPASDDYFLMARQKFLSILILRSIPTNRAQNRSTSIANTNSIQSNPSVMKPRSAIALALVLVLVLSASSATSKTDVGSPAQPTIPISPTAHDVKTVKEICAEAVDAKYVDSCAAVIRDGAKAAKEPVDSLDAFGALWVSLFSTVDVTRALVSVIEQELDRNGDNYEEPTKAGLRTCAERLETAARKLIMQRDDLLKNDYNEAHARVRNWLSESFSGFKLCMAAFDKHSDEASKLMLFRDRFELLGTLADRFVNLIWPTNKDDHGETA